MVIDFNMKIEILLYYVFGTLTIYSSFILWILYMFIVNFTIPLYNEIQLSFKSNEEIIKLMNSK